MLIIIDKKTKKVKNNMGTNSLFPDGNIPNVQINDDEDVARIHDDNPIAKTIMGACEYDLVVDEKGNIADVIVHKTIEERLKEKEKEPKKIEFNQDLAVAYNAIAMLYEKIEILETEINRLKGGL